MAEWYDPDKYTTEDADDTMSLAQKKFGDVERIVFFGSEIETVYNTPLAEQGRRRKDKPAGFWYGCGLEWLNFSVFDVGSMPDPHVYEVTLVPESGMLFIKTYDEIRAFSREYGVSTWDDGWVDGIDWRRVAEEYTGIEICPYITQARPAISDDHETDWYGSWDVASGCIWNVEAIEGVYEL